MSYRAHIGSKIKLMRVIVNGPNRAASRVGGVDLLKLNPPDPSEGLREYIQMERSELLMLNRDLDIPVGWNTFRPDFKPRIRFFTQDAQTGYMYCAGLSYPQIEQHVRTLIESLRDGKPQNIVKFESLTKPNEGEWDWLVDYLKRKSPLVIHEK